MTDALANPNSPPPDAPAARSLAAADEDAGLRLDRFLARRLPDLSRSRLTELIRQGQVSEEHADREHDGESRGAANGRTIVDPAHRVKSGDSFFIALPEPQPAGPEAEDIPLNIVYEDKALVVVDKPAGLVVHPAAGHWTGTLVNALIAHCGDSLSGIGGVKRPGIVHRLDKDTSGLLVVAKTDASHIGLAEQFADHGREGPLERSYLALVWGAPPKHQGAVVTRIGRDPHNRQKMKVLKEGGKEAITHYRILETFTLRGAGPRIGPGAPLASLVECRLETGRTHQIRVHMAHLACPVMSDATYASGFLSKNRALPEDVQSAIMTLNRQALHATVLGFEHPYTGKALRFESTVPCDMARLLRVLQGRAS
jgi:23S rRNA pseudouridine1911/1915/1917 synthase